jgi:putative peptide zinc metalloprotease protein
MDEPVTGSVVPCRPPGVEPEGRLQGSGFADEQWLIRRDRQFVQVDELLYRVVELADGARTLEDIARELTAATQWEVAAEDVALIVQRRLVPLGLIADGDPAHERSSSARPNSPLLANARLRIIGPRAIDRMARVLQHLYRRPALLAALSCVVISQVWLFSLGDPNAAIQQVVATPLSLPLIAGLLVVAGVVHEFGHAAALRYGGGRARAMGAGLYLFIPVFYTDVTEAYRLGRAARVRTDLGGLYFHLIAAGAFIAGGAITGNEFLLVAAFLIDLDVARQLIPFIRLDGYWVLADLTGIPDLFAHAGPRLRRRLSGKPTGPSPAPLRRGVRHILIAYTALAVPFVAGLMGYVAWHAPSIFERTKTAISVHAEVVDATVARGDWGHASLATVEMLLLALPAAGLAFFFLVLTRGVVRIASRWASSGREQPQPAAQAETMTFEEAIADHLELKRRHAEEAGTAPEQQPVAV